MTISALQSLSFTFSVTEAKPLVGCCVRMSKTWNLPSRDVATNLFILMSFLSNSKLHTWKQRIYLLLIGSYILYLLKTGYGCSACFHICTPGMCLVSREARREGQNPWNWSYRRFWAIMCVLATKSWSSGRTFSVFYYWAISPDLVGPFKLSEWLQMVLEYSLSPLNL